MQQRQEASVRSRWGPDKARARLIWMRKSEIEMGERKRNSGRWQRWLEQGAKAMFDRKSKSANGARAKLAQEREQRPEPGRGTEAR
eukprot:6187987-Pleurochrysis_carterae.AAC.10